MAFEGEGRAYVVVTVASIALYVNSIFCGFVFDDVPAIKNNKDLDPDSPWSNLLFNDFWGTSMSKERSHKSYRPLTVFTFKLNNQIFGREPWSYHVINVLLHATVCMLYLKLCMVVCEVCSKHDGSISKKNTKTPQSKDANAMQVGSNWKQIAYVATALFVTHPVHCEAVTGVVGRAELLSATFVLLSLLSYMKFTKFSMFFSAFYCICAVASKEQGISVIAICAVFDFFIAHRLTPLEFLLLRKTSNIYTGMRVATIFFVACVALLWRFSVMQGIIPSFSNFDNLASWSPSPTRQLTYNFLLAQNSWLLINPGKLLCDYTMGTVPLVSKISDPRNIASLAFWVILLGLSWVAASRRKSSAKITLVALAFIVFPFLPASNLFFPVGFVIAERILYVPSMGYCLLVSLGFVKLMQYRRLKTIVFGILVVILMCFSVKTVLRNFQWKSDYTLFQSGLQVTKSNAKIWNNIGHALEEDYPETALLYFLEAAKVQPDDIGAHMNVGRIKKRLKLYTEAEESYRRAKDLLPKKVPGKRVTARISPDHLQLFVQLGNLLKLNESRLTEVDELYKEVISMRSDFTEAYINRGEILILLGKFDDAIKCYEEALLLSDKKDDIYFNLAVVHSQNGNISGAVEYYTYAIQKNPNHIKALYNSAVLFEETGNKDLVRRAKIRVERVLKLEPENHLALSLLGSIHLDNGDEDGAVTHWKKVLEVHPDDKSALFNMAFMYSKKQNGTDQCLRLVETLLTFHPNYIKGLMLYGDVLMNKKKDTKAAAEAFKRIIENDPNDVRARHNFCVVILEEGRLTDAEKCMHDVLLMAPNAKYVANNLAIIRKHIAKRKIDSDIGFTGNTKKDDKNLSDEAKIPREPREEPEDEDLVFVEPVRKKTYSEKAKLILADAKKAAGLVSEGSDKEKPENLENALKKLHGAVRKLKTLNEDVATDYVKKCPTKAKTEKIDSVQPGKDNAKPSVKTQNLRKRALDLLDELEDGLS